MADKRQQQACVGKVLSQMKSRFLAQAIREWTDQVQQEKKRQVALARFGAKLLNSFAARVFGTWFDTVAFWKQQRVILARCRVRMMRRQERASLDGWLEFVDARQAARALIGRILQRLLNSSLGQGFHRWHRTCRALEAEHRTNAHSETHHEYAVSTRLLKREHAVAAITKLFGELLQKVFLSWRLLARRKRRENELTTRFATKWLRATNAVVLSTWLDHVHERRYARQILGRILGRQRVSALHMAFRAWNWSTALRTFGDAKLLVHELEERNAMLLGQVRRCAL